MPFARVLYSFTGRVSSTGSIPYKKLTQTSSNRASWLDETVCSDQHELFQILWGSNSAIGISSSRGSSSTTAQRHDNCNCSQRPHTRLQTAGDGSQQRTGGSWEPCAVLCGWSAAGVLEAGVSGVPSCRCAWRVLLYACIHTAKPTAKYCAALRTSWPQWLTLQVFSEVARAVRCVPASERPALGSSSSRLSPHPRPQVHHYRCAHAGSCSSPVRTAPKARHAVRLARRAVPCHSCF